MDYFALKSSTVPTLNQLVVAANRTKTKPTSGYWMAGNNFGFIESSDGTVIDARDQPVGISRSAKRFADLVTMGISVQSLVAPKTGYFSAGGVDFKDQLQITASSKAKNPRTITRDGKTINVLSVNLNSVSFDDLGLPLDGYCIVSSRICFFYRGFVLFNEYSNTSIGSHYCQMTDGSYQSLPIKTDDSRCVVPEDVEFIQFGNGTPVKVVEGGFEPGFDAKGEQLLILPYSSGIYYKSLGDIIKTPMQADGPYYNADGTLYANKTAVINSKNYFFDNNGMKSQYTGDLCQFISGAGSLGMELGSDRVLTVTGTYPTPQATGTPFVVFGGKNLVVATDGTTKTATQISVIDSNGTKITTLADGTEATMTMAALPDGKYNNGRIIIKGMVVQPDAVGSHLSLVLKIVILVLILAIVVVIGRAFYLHEKKMAGREHSALSDDGIKSV
jgi:hypothetical protein